MGNESETKFIESFVLEKFGVKPDFLKEIGGGGGGKVYRADIGKQPYKLAVKISEHSEILKEEYDYISFLSGKADIKLPKIYAHRDKNDENFAGMIMEFFDGVSLENLKTIFLSRKSKAGLADEIVSNLVKLHNVKNDKFGPINNAVYDDWNSYYKPFADKIIEFVRADAAAGKFNARVAAVMERAYEKYSDIFDANTGRATLIHGDYWAPNLIVNPKKAELIGVIDPFNVLWADREYDLFPLVVGKGRKLNLYERYKKLYPVSEKCDLKIEFYAIFSEAFWYSRTGHKYDDFFLYKAKELEKQLNRFL